MVGVWCDGYFKVEPQIKTLINRIDSLNSTLIALKEGSDVVKEHIVQKSENGTNCKVGYSVNIRGNVAYVGKNNSLNLKKRDLIQITYEQGFKSVSITVIVDITDSGNDSTADIFLSKESFESLGITGKDLYKGIFDMYYKYVSEND